MRLADDIRHIDSRTDAVTKRIGRERLIDLLAPDCGVERLNTALGEVHGVRELLLSARAGELLGFLNRIGGDGADALTFVAEYLTEHERGEHLDCLQPIE